MEKEQIKKVYLVDSENVADLWVTHVMKLAKPEDDIIVFYTPKSPHMGYDHIRMLLNSTHEVEFVKCVEGQNALDFQLVTELGYQLGNRKEDIEYIIVTNDNGFDAVVKYWQNREMPVKRYNAKYCHNLVNQQETAKKELEEKMRKESEMEIVPVTIQLLQELQEDVVESTDKANNDITEPEKIESSKEDTKELESIIESVAKEKKTKSIAEVLVKENETEVVSEVLAVENKTEVVSEVLAVENKTEVVSEVLAAENKTEVVSEVLVEKNKIEPIVKVENQQKEKEPVADKRNKKKLTKNKQKMNEKTVGEKQQELIAESKQSTTEQDTGEALVKNLVSCIGTKNIPDIHNALICLLGSQKGKEVYKQVKGKLNDYVPENKMQIKNRFKTYCQIIFEHSEQKEECPKDFSKFVYDAKDKRKNLNSFRSALQNEYGKEKGMSYYTIMKPHVKILNRMQNA